MIQISLKNPSRQTPQKDTGENPREPSCNVKTIASVRCLGKIQINLQRMKEKPLNLTLPVTPQTYTKDDLFLHLNITPIRPLFFSACTPLTFCTDHPHPLQISFLIGHASLHLLGCHQTTLMIPSSFSSPSLAGS